MIYSTYLSTMDDCNNNSCLLQCFHNDLNTHLKIPYIVNYSRWKSFMPGFWQIDWQPCETFPAYIIILLAITLLCEYGQHAIVNVLSELQLISTTVKLHQTICSMQ